VLARNEAGRDQPHNRRLFLRVSHGHYVLNPEIELRTGNGFTPVYDVMGVPRMAALGLRRYEEAAALVERARGWARRRRDPLRTDGPRAPRGSA
jgi:hypothetical protein